VRAELNKASLVKANAQFWEQMLGMQLELTVCAEIFSSSEEHLLASVSLSGAWTGRIEIGLSRGLARAATAAMMMQPEDALSEADVLDAIREIANMIGGVIKSSLPRPCAMALPESAVATGGLCNEPEQDDTLTVAFHHAAGALMVKVQEEDRAETLVNN
jgi:CheY-specific phosphatase CheX